MNKQTPNPDFTTVLNKNFYTVLYRGVALLTVQPVQLASPIKQVQLNYKDAQGHIKALQAGKCVLPAVQNKYNQLKQLQTQKS